MTEFEKKSLYYALFYAWFCLLFLLPYYRDFLDVGHHLLLFAGAFVILFFLFTVFGLWKTAWTSRGYFREDNLTEREQFLFYKATSKTLGFFTLGSSFAVMGGFYYEIIKEVNSEGAKKIEHEISVTCDILDIITCGMAIVIAFLCVKSFVLYTYLRKEPRELPEVH